MEEMNKNSKDNNKLFKTVKQNVRRDKTVNS